MNKVDSKLKKAMKSWGRFFLSIIIVFGVGYVLLNHVPFIARYKHYVIVTSSMRPTINVGDVVIINSDLDLDRLAPNDIVAFYVDFNDNGQEDVVVHYLADIIYEDGERNFITRRENTTTVDPWVLTDADMIGIYSFHIPRVGRILLFAQSPIGRAIIIFDIIIVYAIVYLLFGKAKDKKNKEI